MHFIHFIFRNLKGLERPAQELDRDQELDQHIDTDLEDIDQDQDRYQDQVQDLDQDIDIDLDIDLDLLDTMFFLMHFIHFIGTRAGNIKILIDLIRPKNEYLSECVQYSFLHHFRL